MIIMGVDPGILATGVVIVDSYSHRVVSVNTFTSAASYKEGRRKIDRKSPERIGEIGTSIMALMAVNGIKCVDAVAVEISQATFQSRHGGGGLASILSTITLGGVVYGLARGLGIEAHMVTPSGWMRGASHMRHAECIALYKDFPKRSNEHCRDALCIADWARQKYKIPPLKHEVLF